LALKLRFCRAPFFLRFLAKLLWQAYFFRVQILFERMAILFFQEALSKDSRKNPEGKNPRALAVELAGEEINDEP
jgi:hypothetical protein